MVTGHFAVAFLAKRAEPKISLGTAAFAAMLVDPIFFVLLIAGIESFAPVPGAKLNRVIGENIAWSHSLLMGILWGAIFAAIYFLWRRYWRGAWILFALVISHWVLDVISHRPDMPLAPGTSVRLGLGLWNSMPATLFIEGGLWLTAIVIYVRSTRSKSIVGLFAFWIGAALLTLIWLSNPAAGINPDAVKAGIGGLVVFLSAIAWAYWMNRAHQDA
jgi:hypothetical protein